MYFPDSSRLGGVNGPGRGAVAKGLLVYKAGGVEQDTSKLPGGTTDTALTTGRSPYLHRWPGKI